MVVKDGKLGPARFKRQSKDFSSPVVGASERLILEKPAIAALLPRTMANNRLPRWRGFNLLEMYMAGSGVGDFREEDFQWIAGWGFDFVRLPLSYTHWIVGGDPFRIDEGGLERVDRAVVLAGRHGLHLCLNLHRAPGYCVNTERREPFNLWRDPLALDAFCLHWETLARRYRGVPGERLSFDLLNEPPRPLPRVFAGRIGGGFTRVSHARVMRAAVSAIRRVDSGRPVILDGLNYGRLPCPELADLPGVAQSCRGYEPFEVTHFRADWVPRHGRWRSPLWPLGRDYLGRRWNRARLEKVYAPWCELMARGVGVHCGEMGCYHHTPHPVFLAWLADLLEVLGHHQIGWALWNFRGPFGVLDSGRADALYEDWHGHALDRALLERLQAG